LADAVHHPAAVGLGVFNWIPGCGPSDRAARRRTWLLPARTFLQRVESALRLAAAVQMPVWVTCPTTNWHWHAGEPQADSTRCKKVLAGKTMFADERTI